MLDDATRKGGACWSRSAVFRRGGLWSWGDSNPLPLVCQTQASPWTLRRYSPGRTTASRVDALSPGAWLHLSLHGRMPERDRRSRFLLPVSATPAARFRNQNRSVFCIFLTPKTAPRMSRLRAVGPRNGGHREPAVSAPTAAAGCRYSEGVRIAPASAGLFAAPMMTSCSSVTRKS